MSGNGLFMMGADLARMDEEQRAEWRREQATKPKAPAPEAAGFNAVQFHADLMNAARQLGVNTQASVARDVGVGAYTLSRMRRGLSPDLATCLLLCDWAGLDPLRYLIHLAPAAANDASARAAA